MLLGTLLGADLDQMPAAITPGRTRAAGGVSSSGNLEALPEEQPLAGGSFDVQQQQQEQQQEEAQQQRRQQGASPQRSPLPRGQQQTAAAAAAAAPENGRQRGERDRERERGGGGLTGSRNGQGGHHDLPFKLPPKYLFTCTVGRSMASKARCGGGRAGGGAGSLPCLHGVVWRG